MCTSVVMCVFVFVVMIPYDACVFVRTYVQTKFLGALIERVRSSCIKCFYAARGGNDIGCASSYSPQTSILSSDSKALLILQYSP